MQHVIDEMISITHDKDASPTSAGHVLKKRKASDTVLQLEAKVAALEVLLINHGGRNGGGNNGKKKPPYNQGLGTYAQLKEYKKLEDVPEDVMAKWTEHSTGCKNQHETKSCRRGTCWMNVGASRVPEIMAEFKRKIV